MMKRTLWRPDTCGCAIAYSWDSEADVSAIEFSDFSMEETCPRHFGLGNAEAIFEAVKAENQNKNIVVKQISDLHQDLQLASEDDDGNINYSPNPRRIKGYYTENGDLHIALTGISSAVKSSVTLAAQGIAGFSFMID